MVVYSLTFFSLKTTIKSSLSTARNLAVLSSGAYIGYKLGHSTDAALEIHSYSLNMALYHYGPFYQNHIAFRQTPFNFKGAYYNRYGVHSQAKSKISIFV